MRRHRRRGKNAGVATADPVAVRRSIMFGSGIALVSVVIVGLTLQQAHSGRFGTWPAWQGELWSLDNMTDYLQVQGLNFDVGSPMDNPSLKAGVVQLQFDGYHEAMQQALDDSNVDIRMHRINTLQRNVHTVFVRRYEKGQSASALDDSAYSYGAYWTWGRFVFRGDKEHIDEIRVILEG